jgi:quercetin dioxygenase-like cupin family protein
MNTTPYTIVHDIDDPSKTPADGTLSRTLHQDKRLKAVLFNFAAGQELSEHTASMPAVVHILQGEAELTLGGDRITARNGTWIHMPAHLPHSIHAATPLTLLLLLLKNP